MMPEDVMAVTYRPIDEKIVQVSVGTTDTTDTVVALSSHGNMYVVFLKPMMKMVDQRWEKLKSPFES